MSHDERNIPIEYAPAATPQQIAHWRVMREIYRERRNRQDAHRLKAVERTQADRRADALRQLRQPGLTPEQRELAIKRLGVRS